MYQEDRGTLLVTVYLQQKHMTSVRLLFSNILVKQISVKHFKA
jgi:hypothetical protein